MSDANCPACGEEAAADAGAYPCRKAALFKGLRLASCRACGLVFAHPMPSVSQLNDYYKSSYWLGDSASINPITEAYYYAQSLARMDFAGVEPGGLQRVLDIGAGSGALYRALRDRGFKGVYDAIEPDEVQLEVIRSWNVGRAYRDMAAIPNADRYDFIVVSHVLEHVPVPKEFLGLVVPRLAPEGILFVEVPNEDHTYKVEIEAHVLFFAPATLEKVLKNHGEIKSMRVCGKRRAALKVEFRSEDTARNGWKSLVPAPVKKIIKKLLGRDKPEPTDLLRKRFELDIYGDDRQWIRALLKPR